MAFKSGSSDSGKYLGFNCIDGVQIKIGEKFIPPSKVTLPLKLETSFQQHNPSEILFMEYDFSVEEDVLRFTEVYRSAMEQHLEVVRQQEEEALREEAAVAATTQTIPDDDPDSGNNSDDSSSKPSEVSQPTSTAPEHSNHGNHWPHPSARHPAPQTNPLLHGLGSAILVPTQMPTSKPLAQSDSAKKSSFDLADFEREQDPFDSAELRVLNDMEELNKVLQNVAPVQDSSGAVCSVGGTVSSSGGPASGSAPGVTTVTVAGSDRAPQYSVPASVKTIEYPELDSLNHTSSQQVPSFSAGYLPNNNSNGLPYQKPTGNGLPYPGSDTVYQTQSAINHYPPTSTNPFIPSGGAAYNKLSDSVTTNPFPYQPSFYQHQQPPGRSETQTAYPFDILSHGAVGGSSVTREAYQNRADGSGLGRLRSCKSTPDISGLAKDAPVYFPTSHTPPPNAREQRAYMQADRRKSSDFLHKFPRSTHSPPLNHKPVYTNPWAPPPQTKDSTYPVSMVTCSSKHRTALSSHHSPGGGTSLPDPYSSMSDEAQNLVCSISAMGFPRPRVARAVHRLGQDGKQVVDLLCVISSLVEKGRYSETDVETALRLCDGQQDKVEQYLQLESQFRQLGFTDDKIRDALLSGKLDENKTLDILTGNA